MFDSLVAVHRRFGPLGLTLAALLMLTGRVLALEEDRPDAASPTPPDHPLQSVMQYAHEALEQIEQIDDYTCLLVKRERIEGKLSPYQYLAAKIRHARSEQEEPVPFSVYLFFHRPTHLQGREVLYVAGQNGDRMLARRGGTRLASVTTWVRPDSRLAMQENRYPITDIGVKNLVLKLIEVGRQDLQYQECQVQFFQKAKVNDVPCTHIRVVHPQKRDYFRFHQADIYVDDQLRIPIRYAAYDWPPQPGQPAVLLEEYTYVNLKLNVGLSDQDFDRNNPAYQFRKEEEP